MPGVTFEHVTKRFDRVVALNDLNLEVKDKEFLVLVGPSGCGKTTALRCLAGLEEATNGLIKIGARVVNDVAPKDRDIAMVFQSYALYPHMTVYDNMAFGLKLRKTPKQDIKRRVQEAAEILGIQDMLTRNPGSFPAASASALRWGVPSFVSRRSSSSTNRFQTWMQNFVSQCVQKLPNFISGCKRHSFM